MSDLPSELLSTIFFRLPAELLYPLRYVCKAWFSLIKDPYFIKIHTAKTRIEEEDSSNIHLVHLNDKGKPPVLSLSSFNFSNLKSIQFKTLSNIPSPLCTCDSEFFTCNGLLLIHNKIQKESSSSWSSSSWSIINPLTREVYNLPPAPLDEKPMKFSKIAIGFGYDSAKDDYKVVTHNLYDGQKFRTFIYSLKSNLWKQINNESFSISKFTRGVFCNGALYWIGRRRQEISDNMIVGFDLESNDIRLYEKFPKDSNLGELGGSLSLSLYTICEDFKGDLRSRVVGIKLRDKNLWSWLLYYNHWGNGFWRISYFASKELLRLRDTNSRQFTLVNLVNLKDRDTFNILLNMCTLHNFRPSLVRIAEVAKNNKRKWKLEEEAKNESQQGENNKRPAT